MSSSIFSAVILRDYVAVDTGRECSSFIEQAPIKSRRLGG